MRILSPNVREALFQSASQIPYLPARLRFAPEPDGPFGLLLGLLLGEDTNFGSAQGAGGRVTGPGIKGLFFGTPTLPGDKPAFSFLIALAEIFLATAFFAVGFLFVIYLHSLIALELNYLNEICLFTLSQYLFFSK